MPMILGLIVGIIALVSLGSILVAILIALFKGIF